MKEKEVSGYKVWRRIHMDNLDKRMSRAGKLLIGSLSVLFVATLILEIFQLFVSAFFEKTPEYARFHSFIGNTESVIAKITVIIAIIAGIVWIWSGIIWSRLKKEEDSHY